MRVWSSLCVQMFVITVLLSLIHNVSGTVFIVDDDGGPWADHNTIQGAINESVDGDEICIFDGVYKERLLIDKGVKLIGNGTDGCNITYSPHIWRNESSVIEITSHNVTIQGFDINVHGNPSKTVPIILFNTSSVNTTYGSVIKECLISGSGYDYDKVDGIHVNGSDHVSIIGVSFDHLGYGLRCNSSKGTTVVNCTFERCGFGISVKISPSTLIEGSIFNQAALSLGPGADSARIKNCTFRGSPFYGTAINIYKSNSPEIIDSLFEDPAGAIRLGDVNWSTIKGNRIVNVARGISLVNSNNASILFNQISHRPANSYQNNVYLIKIDGGMDNSITRNDLVNSPGLSVIVRDDGKDTIWSWDDQKMGNYWSDFSSIDSDNDSIYDEPRTIFGDANSTDMFPQVHPYTSFKPIVVIDWVLYGKDTDGIRKIHLDADPRVAVYELVHYEWRSSIDGIFYSGPEDNIWISNLTGGKHILYLRAMNDRGIWSEEVSMEFEVEESEKEETDPNERLYVILLSLTLIVISLVALRDLRKKRPDAVRRR